MKSINEKLKQIILSVLASRPVLRVLEVFDHRMENRMTEFGMIAQAFQFKAINEVVGDYFEFGLWRGKTFLYANKMKHRYAVPHTVLRGFDSFEGLPPHEDTPYNIWHEGQFSCSEEEFRAILKRNGIKQNEFDLVKGYYNDSLNEAVDKRLEGVKAAIVYIDCDLYESTRDVLQFLKKYLVNGSIVCFDDYYNYQGAPDQGEAKALAEFTSMNEDVNFIPYFDFSPLGRSYIVRLN